MSDTNEEAFAEMLRRLEDVPLPDRVSSSSEEHIKELAAVIACVL